MVARFVRRGHMEGGARGGVSNAQRGREAGMRDLPGVSLKIVAAEGAEVVLRSGMHARVAVAPPRNERASDDADEEGVMKGLAKTKTAESWTFAAC